MKSKYVDSIFKLLDLKNEDLQFSISTANTQLAKCKSGSKEFQDLTAEVSQLRAESKAVFSIKSYLESGVFTDSRQEQFLCQYHDLSFYELAKKWTSLGNKERNEAAIRAQSSKLNKKLYFLLGYSQDDFVDLLNNHSDELLALGEKCSLLSKIRDTEIEGYLNEELIRFMNEYEPEGEYELADCQQEVALVKMTSSNNIKNLINLHDKDKLGYVLQRLRAPLYIKDEVHCSTYKTKSKDKVGYFETKVSHQYGNVINDYKLEVERYLFEAEVSDFHLVIPVDTASTTEYTDDIIDEVVEVDDVYTLSNPWGITVSNTASHLFEDFLERYEHTCPDKKTEYLKSVSNLEIAVETCKDELRKLEVTTSFTEICVFIESQNQAVLSLALNELGTAPKRSRESVLVLNEPEETKISDFIGVLDIPDVILLAADNYSSTLPHSDSAPSENNVAKLEKFFSKFTYDTIYSQFSKSTFTTLEIKTALQNLYNKANNIGDE